MPTKSLSHRIALHALSLIGFLISSSLFFSVLANSSEQDRVLRFNVSPNGYPPYLIVEDNKSAGIIWDVVSVIADRIGYTVVPEQIPRKRVDAMLLEGRIDATSRAIEWTDNPDRFLFTDAIVPLEEVLFIPASSQLGYQKPEDLFSRTVVTHLGYSYPALETHFESGNIKRFDVSRDRDMFRFVVHGQHFDAAIADRLVGQWILKNEGLQGEFRISKESISNYPFRLMLRKDWTDFADRFNAELAVIQENGELEAILSEYR
ncbi:substrate-binding periplasmic protein [Marinobacter sp.]|uniref:substrate-binding periplasmic protein n=1 Tax=Marinobacter sp. TaxID=50741 RepID=UPI0034A18CEF